MTLETCEKFLKFAILNRFQDFMIAKPWRLEVSIDGERTVNRMLIVYIGTFGTPNYCHTILKMNSKSNKKSIIFDG